MRARARMCMHVKTSNATVDLLICVFAHLCEYTGGKIPTCRISWPNGKCVYYILLDISKLSYKRMYGHLFSNKSAEINWLLIPSVELCVIKLLDSEQWFSIVIFVYLSKE